MTRLSVVILAAIVLVAIAVPSALVVVGLGRYQLARVGDIFFVRLNTQTGEMRAYTLGLETQRDYFESRQVRFFEVATTAVRP